MTDRAKYLKLRQELENRVGRVKYLQDIKDLENLRLKVKKGGETFKAKVFEMAPQPLMDWSWGVHIYKNQKKILDYLFISHIEGDDLFTRKNMEKLLKHNGYEII